MTSWVPEESPEARSHNLAAVTYKIKYLQAPAEIS